MNIGARKAVLISALLGLLVAGWLCAFPTPAFAQDNEVQKLFAQAKDLWQQGKAEEAGKILREILAKDPSQETAYDLLRKAEYQMFLDLLKAGGDTEHAVKELMRLAQQEERKKIKDEDAIRALADKAVHGSDLATRREAVQMLVARHGEYSVPWLWKFLGSNDTDERVNAILALDQLGADAVLPLTEVLQSGSWMVRKNAAQVLQTIGDLRALGGLAALAAHEKNPAVKAAAMEAVARLQQEIGGGHCGKKGHPDCACAKLKKGPVPPAAAYLLLARKYYMKDAAVIRNYADTFTLWSFKDGELVSREVPGYLYHLELAEEACYDALAEEPASQAARAILAAIYYAEWGVLNSLSAEARGTEEVKALLDRFARILALNTTQGADTQLGALSIGLMWRDGNIARGALAAIPKVWDGRAITADSPLVKALDAPDKTVRFAAAITLLEIDPGKPFPGAEKVVPIAAKAVDTGSLRQVLLIEPDAKIRAKALHALDEAGLWSVAEATGMGGFIRAKEVGTFDVIVIRAGLPDTLTQRIVKQLKDDFRTADVPIVISGTPAQLDEAKKLIGTAAVDYIAADPIDPAKVRDAAAASLNDDQKRAIEVSGEACRALAGLVMAHTAYKDFGAAEAALARVLASDKPDDVKIAALDALGNLRGTKGVQAITETFGTGANAVPVRVAAAKALGRIFAGKAAPGMVFDALLAGLGDEAAGVRQAAGDALGGMKLTPAQRNAVLTKYRVN